MAGILSGFVAENIVNEVFGIKGMEWRFGENMFRHPQREGASPIP
jgi:hypothetical protein